MKSNINRAGRFLAQRHLFVNHRESIKSAGISCQAIFNNTRNRIGYNEGRINRGCLILYCNLIYLKYGCRITIGGDRLRDG
jgi:hypothetical protein